MNTVVGRITDLAKSGVAAAKDLAETSFDKATDLGQAAIAKAREKLDGGEGEVIDLPASLTVGTTGDTLADLKNDLSTLIEGYRRKGLRDKNIKVELEAAAADL